MIRMATDDDIDDILVMAKSILDEGRFRSHDFDPVHIAAQITDLLEDGFVAILPGKAFMLAEKAPFWFDPDQFLAHDLVLYVMPEYRRSSIGAEMVEMYFAWATEQGCTECQIQPSVGINNDACERMLERQGFVAHGRQMVKACP